MTSTCHYCNNVFRGARSTKKYCNDNCRQMAYLSRRGFTSVDGTDNVKPVFKAYNANNNVKYSSNVNPTIKYVSDIDPDVKYHNNIKPDVKAVNDVKTQTVSAKHDTHSDMDLELLFDKLSDLIETKITQAVEALRKEMSVKDTKEDNVKMQNVKLCSPCNVNEFMPTLTASINTVNGTDEPGLCNEDDETKPDYEDEPQYQEEQKIEEPEYNELEAAKFRIQQLGHELFETKKKLVQKLTIDAEAQLAGQEEPIEQETEEFVEEEMEEPVEIEEPVTPDTEEPEEGETGKPENPQTISGTSEKFDVGSVPRLHLHIERMLEDGQHGYVFDNPLRHWPESDVKNILWVNVRLRCLLVSLVRMTNFAHVDKESFTTLTNGFISLHNSKAFQSLPANYPYTNLFIELTDWLRGCALKQGGREQIKVILTVKRKALIVAICHELAQNTEIVKFSELNFEPLETKRLHAKTGYYKQAA